MGGGIDGRRNTSCGWAGITSKDGCTVQDWSCDELPWEAQTGKNHKSYKSIVEDDKKKNLNETGGLCHFSIFDIYCPINVFWRVFYQTHPSLSLAMERNSGNKAVIHNPFTMQQQIYLKTIQSEFIHAFLNEDYNESLYCSMFIKKFNLDLGSNYKCTGKLKNN